MKREAPKGFRKVEGVGSASIFRGDPRLPENHIDSWWNGLLATVSPAKARPYLYGSDAGLCARRNVLHEHNTWIPDQKDATTVAYMAIGVALEDMLAKGLRSHERLLAQGMHLLNMPEIKIRGKIDLIILDHEEELALVEVKSCGKLPLEPNPVHLAQIQVYAAVTGIHKAWLTYVSRTVRNEYGPRLAIKTFPVDTDYEVLHKRLTIASISMLSSKLHKVPPVPATFRKSIECHYCEYLDFCWTNRLTGKLEMIPLPELSPTESLGIQLQSQILASSLMAESQVRYIETLETIIKDYPLSEYQEAILQELLDKL
jgi:CRISPR/Cas system-associated exonuclease Cas4 (RecB family)